MRSCSTCDNLLRAPTSNTNALFCYEIRLAIRIMPRFVYKTNFLLTSSWLSSLMVENYYSAGWVTTIETTIPLNLVSKIWIRKKSKPHNDESVTSLSCLTFVVGTMTRKYWKYTRHPSPNSTLTKAWYCQSLSLIQYFHKSERDGVWYRYKISICTILCKPPRVLFIILGYLRFNLNKIKTNIDFNKNACYFSIIFSALDIKKIKKIRDNFVQQ